MAPYQTGLVNSIMEVNENEGLLHVLPVSLTVGKSAYVMNTNS